MPSETALLWPYFVRDKILRASESRLRPLKKRLKVGAATPITMSNIAITRISSINVKAALLLFRLLPVRNIIISSSAAIRAHRHHIVRTWVVLARAFVHVGMTPWVIRDFAFQVRPLPVLRVAGLLHKVVQSALALGIITVVNLERIKGGFEYFDLRLRGCISGLFC